MPENAGGLLQRAQEAIVSFGKMGIIAVVLLVILYIVYKVLTGKKKPAGKTAEDLAIDVMSLGAQGPPAGATTLEYLNTPVRLAAIVLAPAGRVRPLPPLNQLGDVYDAIVPEMSKVVATHKPLVRRWPAQLSAKGFAHMVFQNCRLPGQGGKGTPWCTVAGIFKIEGQPLFAGLILRTESTSSHGQEIVDAEEQWLASLRVKA